MRDGDSRKKRWGERGGGGRIFIGWVENGKSENLNHWTVWTILSWRRGLKYKFQRDVVPDTLFKCNWKSFVLEIETLNFQFYRSNHTYSFTKKIQKKRRNGALNSFKAPRCVLLVAATHFSVCRIYHILEVSLFIWLPLVSIRLVFKAPPVNLGRVGSHRKHFCLHLEVG